MPWQGSARKTEHCVRHAQAANLAFTIACEHVALQHGISQLQEPLPTAVCGATCTSVPALSHSCQGNTPGMCAGSSPLFPSQRRSTTPCEATAWCRSSRAGTSISTLMDIPAQSLCLTWPRGAACCAGSKTACEHCPMFSSRVRHSKSPHALRCAGVTQLPHARC